jgi:hypothetical protein
MRVIFFSGLKGGTGKTTLAVHFCNYIHFYEKKTVCLVILSLLARKDNSPYQVIETAIGEFGAAFLESLQQQYIVVDFPGTSIEEAVIQHWAFADVHVLPFLSGALDFYKLLAFFQLASQGNIQLKQAYLLPNQYDKKVGNVMLKNLQEQPIFSKCVTLPPIIQSHNFINVNFSPLNSTIINYCRPAFNHIAHNKTYKF